MGALTGNTPGSTYLDLVQLGKSGAGLPAHAGKEAALYDGSGAQILGRTAVRHWLDPHPDAASFAETWEFSTTGDMTQGQLETAGWTFTNCTGIVSRGMFILTCTSASTKTYASLSTSLSGDFDFIASIATPFNYGSIVASSWAMGGLGVADTVNDKAHLVCIDQNGADGTYGLYAKLGATFSTFADGTLSDASGFAHDTPTLRICRVSGTVYVATARGETYFVTGVPGATKDGWRGVKNSADANAMTTLVLTPDRGTSVRAGGMYAYKFIRRYA